jgi:hypothetical protein
MPDELELSLNPHAVVEEIMRRIQDNAVIASEVLYARRIGSPARFT